MIAATVSRVQAIARDTVLLELQASDGRALPAAAPGAHIDLHLPNGLVRQYSLTNATGAAALGADQSAVARDAHSRGGSSWVHDKLRVGTALNLSAPRNLFALDSSVRGPVLFIGAGIATTVEEPKRESATKRPASRAAKE